MRKIYDYTILIIITSQIKKLSCETSHRQHTLMDCLKRDTIDEKMLILCQVIQKTTSRFFKAKLINNTINKVTNYLNVY